MNQRLHKFKEHDQKNLFVAMVVVLIALFAMDFIFPDAKKPIPAATPAEIIQEAQKAPEPVRLASTDIIPVPTQTIALKNDAVAGVMNVGNGGIDDLSLLKYKETTTKDSQNVQLLKKGEYTTALHWHNIDMPANPAGAWTVSGTELTEKTPVTMTLNAVGMRLERVVTLDDAYMMTVTDTVYNTSDKAISVYLNGQINRTMEKLPPMSTVHEGFVGVLNGSLVEKRYSDVTAEKPVSLTSNGGWMGVTDKYWMTAFALDATLKDVGIKFTHANSKYAATFASAVQSIPTGGKMTATTKIFVGAKELSAINKYADEGIHKFDLAIDFGWFYFLTKPFLIFLTWLYAMVGNMGVSILIFATLLRLLLLNTATKSYESMAKMRKVAPKIAELRERYKDDRMRLQQETMALYKREKVNPAAGCLPMLIQIPVFFALFKVLSVSIQMRQAPFFGWIQDLSIPDPSSVFTLFHLIDWPIPHFLDIGVWPLLMGLTMWLQQKMSPAPTDKAQANMMKMLPIVFTFMLGNFAAGLVIYWTWSNLLSIAQQRYVMKKVEGK